MCLLLISTFYGAANVANNFPVIALTGLFVAIATAGCYLSDNRRRHTTDIVQGQQQPAVAGFLINLAA